MRLPLVPQPFFFFNDTATTEIYPLSLHDALPIFLNTGHVPGRQGNTHPSVVPYRSEEHTSELQSHLKLVCRLLLQKKQYQGRRSHLWFMPHATSHAGAHTITPRLSPP